MIFTRDFVTRNSCIILYLNNISKKKKGGADSYIDPQAGVITNAYMYIHTYRYICYASGPVQLKCIDEDPRHHVFR